MEGWLVYASVLAGFISAWSIGANDVANSFGTAFGSKSLTIAQALVLASVCEFLGSVSLGRFVSNTIKSNLIDVDKFFQGCHGNDGTTVAMVGFFSTLCSTSIWLVLATRWALPVSTTHAIVGSVVGFGIVAEGYTAVRWGSLWKIVLSWVTSPLLSMVLAFIIHGCIKRFIVDPPQRWLWGTDRISRVTRGIPVFAGLTAMVILLAFFDALIKLTHAHIPLWVRYPVSLTLALITAFITSKFIFRRVVHQAVVDDEDVRDVNPRSWILTLSENLRDSIFKVEDTEWEFDNTEAARVIFPLDTALKDLEAGDIAAVAVHTLIDFSDKSSRNVWGLPGRHHAMVVVGDEAIAETARSIIASHIEVIVARGSISFEERPDASGITADKLVRFKTHPILGTIDDQEAVRRKAFSGILVVNSEQFEETFVQLRTEEREGLYAIASYSGKFALLKNELYFAAPTSNAPPVKDFLHDSSPQENSLFRPLVVALACFKSFAHGANDVANAVGPIAAVVLLSEKKSTSASVPFWILLICGLGIVLGLFMWGGKVMHTIGRHIAPIDASRAFVINFSTVVTLIAATLLGIPVSTTHVTVGGVIGVGLYDNWRKVNWGVVWNIGKCMVLTLPVSMLLSAAIFGLLAPAVLGRGLQ